ncbi:poly-gamma-glutamate synthase PgsB [Streptomyces sp. NPDC087844]|uniref:poly-gamma-glutamate synthase PgsB n=1 Tax=Streptomyces sp. NPDC087844 TaxID=3365805 RepID=UPI003805DA91
MLYLYFVLLVGAVLLLVAGIVEQRRHYAALHSIPSRVLVNGIRGKSSITRLCAGALRGGDLVTVAKTTGTAARFIHPDATEEPVYRKFGIANVVEQIGIVRRAATYRPDALVIECMAVMPALQEVNQSKLIRSTIGVLCNVREDHLAEMGPTLDDVARSLCRSMPEGGICVTAEQDRFHILQEEADARDCELVYADPAMVSDDELRGFSWFTFKENVAIALVVADLLGVDREIALQGMYDAPPDPGVLSVERYQAPGDKRLAFANVFAANDPESTLMNINQLLDLGAIHRPLNVVINCRPDRVERNGQMGEIIPDLQPDNVFVIGHPAKSAIDAIPAEWRDRAVDLGGERRSAEEFMPTLLGRLAADSSLVAIGNIHGQGEELLEYLAELPTDETAAENPAGNSADLAEAQAVPAAQLAQPTRLDPYASYPVAYEERYQAEQTQGFPAVRLPEGGRGHRAVPAQRTHGMPAYGTPAHRTGAYGDPAAEQYPGYDTQAGQDGYDVPVEDDWPYHITGYGPGGGESHDGTAYPAADGGGQPPHS